VTATLAPGHIPQTAYQRMPWHAQAKLNHALDVEARTLGEQVGTLSARRDELASEVQALEERARSLKCWLDLRTSTDTRFERVMWASEDLWSYDELKTAHAAYGRGERDEWTVLGNRLWERHRYRQKRLPECPDCGQPKAIGAAKCPDCRSLRTA